jgi:hypothetical protein
VVLVAVVPLPPLIAGITTSRSRSSRSSACPTSFSACRRGIQLTTTSTLKMADNILVIISRVLRLIFIVIVIVLVVRRHVAAAGAHVTTCAKHFSELHQTLRARRLARATAQQLARGQRHVVLVLVRIGGVAAVRTDTDTNTACGTSCSTSPGTTAASIAADGGDNRTLKLAIPP